MGSHRQVIVCIGEVGGRAFGVFAVQVDKAGCAREVKIESAQ
ncbi:MAG TPA: hypothetical protein VGN44_09205 [Candidatus Angelobacter sp.]|jgi:hypothetical protein